LKPLTIIYTSARRSPCFDWFLDSLRIEADGKCSDFELIFVDFMFGQRAHPIAPLPDNFRHVPCKPSVWQGQHRLTKDHWWAKSAYLNTGLCLAKGEWVACVDDRSLLRPGFFAAIKEAMKGGYGVAGSYEKRVNMKVEGGRIVDHGTTIGFDPRMKGYSGKPVMTYGEKFYGCINSMPLEWALKVGGYDESCDSLGYEDTIFGHTLARNGLIIKFDPRMKIIEDRTLPECESLVKRTDKGISPNDKSHALENRTGGKLTATHDFNIRHVRDMVQRGEPFPIPTTPTHDWYDGKPLTEFP